MAKFTDYNLHPEIQNAIDELGFTEATKIQEKSIPLIQEGTDVAGLAQTGTGKTAAFLIPLLQRLYVTKKVDESYENSSVKAFEGWGPRSTILALVPTRELAEQVATNLKDLSKGKATYVTVYGGVAYDKQKKYLEEGVEFVIATPGRLIDLYKEKFFDPSQVKAVVFDEADRMFDMGFKEDMCYLLDRIPRDRQFLVYSATLNFDVLTVAYEFGSDPVEIEIDRSLPKTDQVKDEILHVGQDEKPKFLLSVLGAQDYEQAVVFSNFVRNVPKIEKFLRDNGLKALGISSALSQSQRNRVMDKFRSGETNILVATDVAARGLDIENVDLVVNYELPDDSENYVHRIGRTGRAGREGVAVSLVSEKDVAALKRLESFLKTKLEIGWIEDADLVVDFKRFPYTYDPKAKLKDAKGPRGAGRRDSKPAYKKGDKKPYKSKDSKPYKSRKTDGAALSNGAKKSKPYDKKKKTSAKSSSGRYDHFKSKPRSGSASKKGLWQSIKSLFS